MLRFPWEGSEGLRIQTTSLCAFPLALRTFTHGAQWMKAPGIHIYATHPSMLHATRNIHSTQTIHRANNATRSSTHSTTHHAYHKPRTKASSRSHIYRIDRAATHLTAHQLIHCALTLFSFHFFSFSFFQKRKETIFE